jgi:hypothetical protein
MSCLQREAVCRRHCSEAADGCGLTLHLGTVLKCRVCLLQVRLAFKPETQQLWIASATSTQKRECHSIHGPGRSATLPGQHSCMPSFSQQSIQHADHSLVCCRITLMLG